MKKYFCGWLIFSAVVMIGAPFAAVKFVAGDGAMALCFLLFYSINPAFSMITGAFSAKNVKQLWSLPIISALMFLVGAWLLFGIGESAFLLYAIVYAALGLASMMVVAFLSKFKRK